MTDTPPPVPVELRSTCAGCGKEIPHITCLVCAGRLCFDCCEKARASHVIHESPKAPAEPADFNPPAETKCSTGHKPFLDHAAFDALVLKLVRDHNLKVEALTELQLADTIRQALLSGEFMKHVRVDGKGQSVTYLPWSETERLRLRYQELLNAVSNRYAYESRHDTALRYIQEREARASNPSEAKSSL